MAASRKQVRSIAFILKGGNDAAVKAGVAEANRLEKKGIGVWVTDKGGCDDCCEGMPKADLALTYGGDGTLVSVARRILGSGVPLAGVNFGRVGFLAELTPDNVSSALDVVLAEGVRVEHRMTLRYSHKREGRELAAGEVVNDVVMTRGKLARLVHLELGVNGKPFVVLRSDGLILSTATGATGYAGSAGGPLLHPSLDVYVVAAICPYLSSFPPLALGAETPFSVVVGEMGTDLYLTLDGQETYPLQVGDAIEVSGACGRFLMADFGLTDYFQRLQDAGFVKGARRPAD